MHETSSAATEPGSEEESLYQRLGGYDAICAATDDLLGRVLNDPRINGYWKGLNTDNKRKARQQLVDFMVAAAGGPAFYVGADMKAAHAGMGINEADWVVLMEHATAMLSHLQVPAREQGEILTFLASLKDDIVEQT
jgi:hemoglobin